MPKFSINFEGTVTTRCVITLENAVLSFEEILSLAHGNFEELNKVLESSIIMIIYLIIYAVVYLMHSIIITFLIKVSWRNTIKVKVKFTLEQATKARGGGGVEV